MEVNGEREQAIPVDCFNPVNKRAKGCKLVNIGPNLFTIGMENMGTVFMDLDAILI